MERGIETVQDETTPRPAAKKSRSLWERPHAPKPFRLQARDIEICEAVYDHRFLDLEQIHTLFEAHPGSVDNILSKTNLSRRCRRLFEHGFLERPKVALATRTLSGTIIYALGKEGALLLEREAAERDTPVEIYRKDFRREPTWGHVQHELLVSRVNVAVRAAVKKLRRQLSDQQAKEFQFGWAPYAEREAIRLTEPRVDPDGYFSFTLPAAAGESSEEQYHHFFEVDRDAKTYDKMRPRYERYFSWWRQNRDDGFFHMRVVTFTETAARMEGLRRVARDIGRNPRSGLPWSGFLFATFAEVSLTEPERLMTPLFRYAEGEKLVGLL